MAKRKAMTLKATETDPDRRERYGEALRASIPPLVSAERALAAVLMAAIHASLPGIQDRNAAYQTEVYEAAFNAAKRAVARLTA